MNRNRENTWLFVYSKYKGHTAPRWRCSLCALSIQLTTGRPCQVGGSLRWTTTAEVAVCRDDLQLYKVVWKKMKALASDWNGLIETVLWWPRLLLDALILELVSPVVINSDQCICERSSVCCCPKCALVSWTTLHVFIGQCFRFWLL